MSVHDEIENTDDVIDSRDVIARIEYLESERHALVEEIDDCQDNINNLDELGEDDTPRRDAAVYELESAEMELDGWDNDEGEELTTLQTLAGQAESSPDWLHGETLIRDSHFTTYAQELAEDCGMISDNANWPNNCIDWERAARELQDDYMDVEFDGVTYWIRA